MRTRVRKELRRLLLGAQTPSERQHWAELEAQMDSARIGTIHSLCAEILRAHPAEAGLDPQFGVVDENEAVRLRAAAVEAALLGPWSSRRCAREPEMRACSTMFSDRPAGRTVSAAAGKSAWKSPPSRFNLALAERAGARSAAAAFCSVKQSNASAGRISPPRPADGSLVAGCRRQAGRSDRSGCWRCLCHGGSRRCSKATAVWLRAALWQARREAMALTVGKKTSHGQGSTARAAGSL